MMRNADRAMANIENIPGGFDAMRNLFHTVQEPLLDAVTEGAVSRLNPSNTNTQQQSPTSRAASAAPTVTPLPNPWAQQSAQPLGGLPGMNAGQQNDLYAQSMQMMLNNPELMQSMMTAMTGGQSGGSGQPSAQGLNSPFGFYPSMFGMGQGMGGVQGTVPGTGAENTASGAGSAIPGMGAGAAPSPFGVPMFNPLLMGGGWGGIPDQGAPVAPLQGFNVNVRNEPPEQRYAAQLVQLEHMGFTNKEQNIRALQNSAGNVERAIELLLQQG